MQSNVHHFKGEAHQFDWDDTIEKVIPPEDSAVGAKGKVVIGPQDAAPNFVFRYFNVEPGGHSTMPDQHLHDHGIMILHGQGEVHLDGKVTTVGPNDIVYIAPNAVHGIVNTGDSPLGFLCVIPNKKRLKAFLDYSGEEA
jgi:quercetin dioxygenase-like cupin family protein